MTGEPLKWDMCRSFLAVLKRGSLSGAARELSLTQPTIGRHVAELETALGTPLFVRSQTGLLPTQTALALAPHAETMAAAATSLLRAASAADQPAGSVRLTTSEFVGVEVIPPILTAFRETCPRIALELLLSDTNQDLLRRDADIAVRMARPTQRALVARRIGEVAIGLYAHRAYLARHGMPRSLADLPDHALIGVDADATSLRAFARSGIPMTREMFAFRSDSEHARLAALRSAFGIGACQAGVASRDAALVPVLPGTFSFAIEMWLVMHRDLRADRRVRLLFDHLAVALSAYVKTAAAGVLPRGKNGRPNSPAKSPKDGNPKG